MSSKSSYGRSRRDYYARKEAEEEARRTREGQERARRIFEQIEENVEKKKMEEFERKMQKQEEFSLTPLDDDDFGIDVLGMFGLEDDYYREEEEEEEEEELDAGSAVRRNLARAKYDARRDRDSDDNLAAFLFSREL